MVRYLYLCEDLYAGSLSAEGQSFEETVSGSLHTALDSLIKDVLAADTHCEEKPSKLGQHSLIYKNK